MEMKLVSLAPTRIPISLPFINSSGPWAIESLLDVFPIPFIAPMSFGVGLVSGIGMIMSCLGDDCGVGDGVGDDIPGIFISCRGDGFGVGVGEGMDIPGILPDPCWPYAKTKLIQTNIRIGITFMQQNVSTKSKRY